MKKSQLKTMFILGLILMLSLLVVYAVTTTLTSPADNYVDDDGYLNLKGTCTPASGQNITQIALFSNVDGTWKANKTITSSPSIGADSVYYANFTNDINQSAEGSYEWNIQCTDNASTSTTSFAGNNTIIVQYAEPTVTTTSPSDGTYDLDGHEIAVVCAASPSSGWNISEVSLITNVRKDGNVGGGAGENWTVNQTFYPVQAQGVAVVANFTINKFGNSSLADGTDLIFGCLANQTKAAGNDLSDLPIVSEKTSANRTLNIEYPPQVGIIKPVSGIWNNTRSISLTWRANTSYDSGTTLLTRVWTNETGVWSPVTGTIRATNNSDYVYTYYFDELTYIDYTIEVIQENDGNVKNTSVNRTIKVDSISPAISITTVNTTTSDTTPPIYATVTDANLDTLRVFTNFSGTWQSNNTNRSLATGVLTNYFNNTALADGVYIWDIEINDSAGNIISSANYSLVIDTVMPTISAVANSSVLGKCDQRNITFTVSEVANYTMQYDIDTNVADGTSVSSSTKATSQGAVLDFDYNGEITYYFNITVTDTAGNKNSSNGQVTYITPARVCAGWTQYAVYNTTSLLEIQNSSGADLVYIWNATNQEWVYKTAGLTSNDGVQLGFLTDYHVVHLYENTNDTWYRSTTNQGVYDYNVSSVNNFIAVPTDYNFGNLTDSFMNESILAGLHSFPSTLNKSGNGQLYTYNITMFAGFNNSAQDYVSHLYNFTWANATLLEPCPLRVNKDTCMETAWIASAFNVTWNSSSIEYNWTI